MVLENTEFINRKYEAPVNLGPMVKVSLGQAGKIQNNSLGENEVYFITNGKPGELLVLDGETGTLKYSETIPNTIATWAMAVGSDKNIYFSGTEDAKLYRYIPVEKRVEFLGINPSSVWTWDLQASNDGKLYGCTYGPGGQGKVYEYDIASRVFRDYGVIKKGQDYVRGIAVNGEYIYAGVGSTYLGLFRINRTTGEKTEINIPGYTGSTGTITDIHVISNKLLVAVSAIKMLVIDMNTMDILGSFLQDTMISESDLANPDLIYYKYGTKLFKYDLKENKQQEIYLTVALPDTARVKDIKWIKLKKGEKAGKNLLAIITQYGEYILFDPDDNWISFINLDIIPQPVSIQSLKTSNNDGRLYLGGYQRGMSIYDPYNKSIAVNISTFPQPENIGFLNNYVYYGTYVDAIMYRFNPDLPVNLWSNPEKVFHIEHQDRPFAITSGDNKLFVGTVGEYGCLGGALAIYDEVDNSWVQYNNPVQDQSIVSLAYKNGLLYGSTSIWGGLGAAPAAEEAKIFIWDVACGKKVDEFTPEISGIDMKPKMIGNIRFGPDGLLWGAVEGTIFAMDVDKKEIKKSKMIMPSTYNSSKWKGYELEFAADGILYTTLSRKVIAINPATLEYKLMDERFVNDITIGIDGSIYYAPHAGCDLVCIKVPETDATLSSITVNGIPIEGFYPGKLKYLLEIKPDDVVEATAAQENAKVLTDIRLKEKQALIRVTAEDRKSTLDYIIYWG